MIPARWVSRAVQIVMALTRYDVRAEIFVGDFQPVIHDCYAHARTLDAGRGVPNGYDVDVLTGGAAGLAGILQVPLVREKRVPATHRYVGDVARTHRARAARDRAGLALAGRLRQHCYGIGRTGKNRRGEGERAVAADR